MNETTPTCCQIAIQGELNIYTATEWRDRLINEAAGLHDIDVDLGEVGEIDCAGFQLLLALRRQAGNEGRQLRITRCSDAVRSFLEFTHQTPLLDPVEAQPQSSDEESLS
ncbi:MAG: anti-sigma factor antagonist [Rhodocyclales bacterium GT-UBC]|nr:MAG: anti-sigma factor antagonist [Rhodocyclales bacterium GT-UBC]